MEQGRSLIEMLGVLALIGILSLSAIIGYQYAMDKYRANETVNEIKMRALTCSQQMLKQEDVSFDEMGYKTKLGYDVDAKTIVSAQDYFEISLAGTSSRVCKQILNLSWTLPATISVGLDYYEGDENICGSAETAGDILFVFKSDLTEGILIDPEDKPHQDRCYYDSDCKCGTCFDGLCESYCPTGSSCTKSYDDPRYLSCCKNETTVNGFCCSLVFQGQCCNSAGNCCPSDTPLQDKSGNCFSCDYNGGVDVTNMTQNCAACPKRTLNAFNKWTGCVLPCDLPGTSTAGKPIMQYGGRCYGCDEITQPIDTNYTPNAGKCSICPNRRSFWKLFGTGLINASECALKCNSNSSKPLLGQDGYCHECTWTGVVPVNNLEKECSILCPNRIVGGYNVTVGKNAFCLLKNCQADKPLQGNAGDCYACNHTIGVDVTGVEENCGACNTSSSPRQIYKMGTLSICAMPYDKAGTPTAGKPLMVHTDVSFISNKGQCFACNDAQNNILTQDKSTCLSTCSNRVWFQTSYTNCPKACAPETPLMVKGLSGYDTTDCVGCDYEGMALIEPLPDTCENVCPGKRKTQGNYCVLSACPEDQYQDTGGTCRMCDQLTTNYIISTATECAKCNGVRTYGFNQNNKCMYPCGQGLATGKPLTDIDGICYACDEKSNITMGNWSDAVIRCSKCPNRKLENGYCNRLSCSKNNPLMASDNTCYPCDITLPINVGSDPEKCTGVCRNRVFKNGLCELL